MPDKIHILLTQRMELYFECLRQRVLQSSLRLLHVTVHLAMRIEDRSSLNLLVRILQVDYSSDLQEQ